MTQPSRLTGHSVTNEQLTADVTTFHKLTAAGSLCSALQPLLRCECRIAFFVCLIALPVLFFPFGALPYSSVQPLLAPETTATVPVTATFLSPTHSIPVVPSLADVAYLLSTLPDDLILRSVGSRRGKRVENVTTQAWQSSVCDRLCHWNWTSRWPSTGREHIYAAYRDAGYEEFVCPSNFRNLADYVTNYQWGRWTNEYPFVQVPQWNAELAACLQPYSLVWEQITDTCGANFACAANHRCRRLFDPQVAYPRAPVLLMTGQSDYPPSTFCPSLAASSPPPIAPAHWFAQNLDHSGPHVSALPIGIHCIMQAPHLRRALVGQYLARSKQRCYSGWPSRTLTAVNWTAVDRTIEQWLEALSEAVLRYDATYLSGNIAELLALSKYHPNEEVRQLNILASQRVLSSASDVAVIESIMERARPNSSQHSARHELIPCSALPNSTIASSSSTLLAPPPADNVRNALEYRSTGSGKLAVLNYGHTHSRRAAVRAALCQAPNNSSWLQCQEKATTPDSATFVSVYRNLSQFLYWISPRGAGLDCYRTWEAIYLGCVPVIERSALDLPLFMDGDVPVLIVDDLTRINDSLLLAHLPRFTDIPRDFPRRTLTFAHWKERILRKRDELVAAAGGGQSMQHADFDPTEERRLPRRCWGATNE